MSQSQSAINLFKYRQQQGKTTVLVFYRADRSFFCKKWIRRWLSILALERRMELCDIFLLFISSQSQGKALSVAEQITENIPLLEKRIYFFGDPEHLLVKYLSQSNFNIPFITNPESHRAHGWVFDYGMVQPAVIAITSNDQILYEWTSKPSLRNVAGKLERPDPWTIWDRIERRVDRIRIKRDRAERRVKSLSPLIKHNQIEMDQISNNSVLDKNHDIHSTTTYPDDDLFYQSIPISPNVPQSPLSPFNNTATSKKYLCNQHLNQVNSLINNNQLQDEQSFQTNRFDAPIDSSFLLDNENHSGCLTDEGVTTAPLSTVLDTIPPEQVQLLISKEEPDVSDEESRPIAPQILSASLSALANQVLAENSINTRRNSHDPNVLLSNLSYAMSPGKRNTENVVDEFENEFDEYCDEVMFSVPLDDFDTTQEIDDNHSSSDEEDEDEEEVTEKIDEAPSPLYGQTAMFEGTITEHSSTDDQEEMTTSESEDQVLDTILSEPVTITEPYESPPSGMEQSINTNRSQNTEMLMFAKRASVLTEDSSHVNTITTDGATSSFDQTIREETENNMEKESDILLEMQDNVNSNFIKGNQQSEKKPDRNKIISENETKHRLVTDSSLSSSVSGTEEKSSSYTPWRTQPDRLTSSIDERALGINKKQTTGILDPTSKNLNDQNEDFESHKKDMELRNDSSRTGSPHPDVRNIEPTIIDASPFADINYELEHYDLTNKTHTQDEYEAYDEYIVCEYEVEEYVEEYESDGLSRSKIYLPTTADESSDTESAATGKTYRRVIPSASTVPHSLSPSIPITTHPKIGLSKSHQNVNDTTNHSRSEHLFQSTNETSSTALIPETQDINYQSEQDESESNVGTVKKVLRKIRSPHNVRRMRDDHETKSIENKVGDDENSRDQDQGEKVSRKDSLLSALRRLPTVPRTQKSLLRDEYNNGVTNDIDEFCDVTEDDGEIVGRKDTIKGLFRLRSSRNETEMTGREVKRGYGRQTTFGQLPSGRNRNSLRMSLLGISSNTSSKLKWNINGEGSNEVRNQGKKGLMNNDEKDTDKAQKVEDSVNNEVASKMEINERAEKEINRLERQVVDDKDMVEDKEYRDNEKIIRTLSKMAHTEEKLLDSNKNNERSNDELDDREEKTSIHEGGWTRKFLRRKRKEEIHGGNEDEDGARNDNNNDEERNGEEVSSKSSFALMSGRLFNRLRVIC